VKGAVLAVAASTAVFLASLTLPVHAAADGSAIYGRCAACHTKTGAGVPGVFPPLGEDFRAMAASDAGRRYLALVVTRGVSGPIKVSGKPYAGVMPAQATLDDASVAAVLNHVGTEIAKAGPAFKPFAEGEVAAIRAEGAALSAQDVGKLHASAGSQ
jgi:mono/diheme cytochrome c family protein